MRRQVSELSLIMNFFMILYTSPLYINSSSTNVFVSFFAKSLLSIVFSRLCVAASPYKAKVIASNIVDFPAPVSPVII